MRFITKIQSISDIITNSSSEVFIMTEAQADWCEREIPDVTCIHSEPITWGWLKNNWYEWEIIFDYLGCDKNEISKYIEWGRNRGYWEEPNEDLWKMWLDENLDLINEMLVDRDLYYVNIEDHFKDAHLFIDLCDSDSLWHDSRH